MINCATFGFDEVKSLVDVGDLVESHLSSVGLGKSLTRDNLESAVEIKEEKDNTYLEEKHQLEAISEVDIDGFDASSSFSEVGIAPSCEGLKPKLSLEFSLDCTFRCCFSHAGSRRPSRSQSSSCCM